MGEFFGKTVSACRGRINNKLFPFELFVAYELFHCSSCDFIIAIKNISCQRIAIGCRWSWVWSRKLLFTSCRQSPSSSSFRPCCSHTLRAGTIPCRCITRSSRWQPSVRLPCPIYSRVNIPSVRPYRVRRLRSNFSKPPGAYFRLVLRVLPTLHPPLVYYGYVFHINLPSLLASYSDGKLITNAGVIVNFKISILISISYVFQDSVILLWLSDFWSSEFMS